MALGDLVWLAVADAHMALENASTPHSRWETFAGTSMRVAVLVCGDNFAMSVQREVHGQVDDCVRCWALPNQLDAHHLIPMTMRTHVLTQGDL